MKVFPLLAGIFAFFSVFPKPSALAGWLYLFLWSFFLYETSSPRSAFLGGLLVGALGFFWLFLGFIGGYPMIPILSWILAALAWGGISYLFVSSIPIFPAYAHPFLFALFLVFIDILISFGPWGIWNVHSVSFSGLSVGAQMVSLFGVHFYTFTVALNASLLSGLLTRRLSFVPTLPAIIWVILMFTLPFLLRNSSGSEGKSVNAAGVSIPSARGEGFIDLVERYGREVKTLAEQGAQIVVIPEGTFYVEAEEKPIFVQAFSSLAQQYKIVVIAGMIDLEENTNEAVLFSPDSMVFYYQKRYPVFLAEPVRRGKNDPLVADTPNGRIGVIICHDDAFPRFVRKAKLQRAEILAVPSFDWYAVHRQHSGISRYTSIFFSMPVIRATGQGISQIVDERGKIMAQSSDFENDPSTVLARVRLSSHSTIYSRIGDAGAYGLLFVGLLAILWWMRCTWFS